MRRSKALLANILALFAVALLAMAGPVSAQEAAPDDEEEEEAAPAEPSPEEAELAKAKEHFAKGKELFDARKFAAAVKEFKEAYRLTKNPLLLYNIGFTLDEANERDLAIFYYEKFLKDAPPEAPTRAAATKRLEALKADRDSEELPEIGDKVPTKTPTAAAGATAFEHNIIEEVPPGKPIDVTAIAPDGQKCVLYYRADGDWERVFMKERYKELVGRIPANLTKSRSIQYYIEVRTSTGKIVDRSAKRTSPNLIYVRDGATARYYPDLDGGEWAGGTTPTSSGSEDDRPRGEYFWYKWGTTGAAAGLIAISMTSFLISSDAASTLEGEAAASVGTDQCPSGPPCRSFSKTQSGLQSRGKNFETIGNVTLALGAVSAIAAGVFWYLEMKGGSKSDSDTNHVNPDDDNPLSSFRAAPVITDEFVGAAAELRF